MQCARLTSTKEKDFALAFNDMRKMVDALMFDLPPWQLWEMFGACFYAVRINASLVLKRSTVMLKTLLRGVQMSARTRGLSVKLVPSRVLRCAGAFGASTPQLIPQSKNQLKKD